MLQDPGQRQRAPQPLRLVQEFVNTVDMENGVEELSSPGELAALLDRLGLGGPELRLGERDLRDALEVREALRRLLLGNNGLPVPHEALATLERAGRAGHLALRFDVCHWVFYDRSRNRSSTWCAMSVCGNRTKTRRYRSRAAGAT